MSNLELNFGNKPAADKVAADKVAADKVAADKVVADKAATNKVSMGYKVAEGKAITSKKGILGPNAEVKAEYLPGGDVTLKELVAKKLIVKCK